MSETVPFKERVRLTAIEEAMAYKNIFVDKEYLIFSRHFKNKPYYILSASSDNYLHLIGVNTNLSAKTFFDKCIDNTLSMDDFDFIKPNNDEKTVKGSVRRKINSLPRIKTIFDSSLLFEENFKKNNIVCAIATTDQLITFGFTNGLKSRPKTLLKGNMLSDDACEIDLILSKNKAEELFTEITFGDKIDITNNLETLYPLVSDDLKNT